MPTHGFSIKPPKVKKLLAGEQKATSSTRVLTQSGGASKAKKFLEHMASDSAQTKRSLTEQLLRSPKKDNVVPLTRRCFLFFHFFLWFPSFFIIFFFLCLFFFVSPFLLCMLLVLFISSVG